jgi:hypothetical protein
MDQKQFEAMLSEAETRLRRLKMLYEQWFMGFERIEPATLRKELEELLARLRKEQMRNTALRFRLQQLVQRHTTFTTYWRRIGRQIEEGTYQRDVLRAKRVRSRAAEEHDDAAPEPELSYDVDLDGELEAALEEANSAVEVATPLPPSAAASAKLKAPLPLPLPTAVTAVVPVVPAPGRGLALPPSAADALATRAARVAAPAAPAGARIGGQHSLSPFSMPASATASAAGTKPVGLAKPAPPQVPAAAGAKPVGVAKPAPPQAPAAAAVKPPGAAKPVPSQAPATVAGGAKPLSVAKPVPSQAPATASTVAAGAKPVGVAKPVQPSASAVGARASRRPAAVSPAAPAQPATPSPAAARDNGAFSSDDVQRIYTQYLAARKQNAERIDNVKRDTIEKTIRGMLPQLEKKHAGKKIDFEVVVKDGKVALKPVAK